jgi:hypothetical protein
MAWSLADIARQVRAELAAGYAHFAVNVRGGAVHVEGVLRLAENGREIDRYKIDVVVRPSYPRRIPDVYETEGRIPRDADHHMYRDGRACLFTPGEQWRHWPRGSNLRDFLEGPVSSFFIGQALFERTEKWEFGQRSHGAIGVLESYQELVGTHDNATLLRYLQVLSRRKLRPWTGCPCGSGRPMTSCHMRKLADLRSKVSYREAAAGLAIIRRDLEEYRRSRGK